MRNRFVFWLIGTAIPAVTLVSHPAGAMTTLNHFVAPAPRVTPRFQAPGIFYRQQIVPRYVPRANPGGRYVIAPHIGSRQGPLVFGPYGWHPPHNRSSFTAIPALVSGGAPVNTEAFIDSIDVASPLEPVAGCSLSPCMWGSMSMANDGSWGTAWNYDNAGAAQSQAVGNCASRAMEACAGIGTVVGTAWIAGLHCQKYDASGTLWRWAVMGNGNDLGAAIRNAYRVVALNGFYNIQECDFVAAVAANGAQMQFVAQE